MKYFDDNDMTDELIQDLKSIMGIDPKSEAIKIMAKEKASLLPIAEYADVSDFVDFIHELVDFVDKRFNEQYKRYHDIK